MVKDFHKKKFLPWIIIYLPNMLQPKRKDIFVKIATFLQLPLLKVCQLIKEDVSKNHLI